MKKFTLSLLLGLLLLPVAFAKRSHLIHMGRNFIVVTPDKMLPGPKPLLVLLHGCKQSPSLILEGTQLEKEAQKNNFIILAPEQPYYYNTDHCWNWFLEMHQSRFMANEMGQIISAIDIVADTEKVDTNRIFVTGISAGGVMAHNLTACYPDVFAASAIHSGLTFKVAENIAEAQTVLTSYQQKSPSYLGARMYECSKGVRKKLKKVLIIHGLSDSRVPSFHSELISDTQAVWRDILDDGRENSSVRGIKKTSNLRSANGYSVEKTDISYPGFLERRLMIKGLGHAWGGGKPISVNFDPKAPSSNDFILDFFDLKK